jgi:FixJ family two-component response regulator
MNKPTFDILYDALEDAEDSPWAALEEEDVKKARRAIIERYKSEEAPISREIGAILRKALIAYDLKSGERAVEKVEADIGTPQYGQDYITERDSEQARSKRGFDWLIQVYG